MAASPTLFTRIIRGEIPGRFVWRDDLVVAFMTIAPIRPGHVLVVPIEEVDHWTDVTPSTWAHLSAVAQTIGKAQLAAFDAPRIGTIVAGLEVPHCHLHLIPIRSESDLSFNLAREASAEDLDAAADAIRAALATAG